MIQSKVMPYLVSKCTARRITSPYSTHTIVTNDYAIKGGALPRVRLVGVPQDGALT